MPCPNCSCPSCLSPASSPIPPTELPPPPPGLLMTNRAPTGPEAAHSRDTICLAEKKISQIQAMVDDLKKQRAELLGLISMHRAVISPIKRCPPELLAGIFAKCVDGAGTSKYLLTKECPPLMLMGVCSLWRGIVLDTPRLWTRILIAPPNIDLWTTRSRELPLQFELNLSWENDRSALNALIPHAHRWEYTNFHLRFNSNSDLALVRDRLHSLKRLKLNFSGIAATVDFCEVAPQLTEVWLRGIYRPVVIKLPWEQLRVCTLDDLEVARYVLQRADNVRTCCLDSSGPQPVDVQNWWLVSMPRAPHSHHPRLDTLTIGAMSHDVGQFLSAVTLPSLRTLDVCLYNDDDDTRNDHGSELASVMFEFLKRSSTHLRALRLVYIPFSESELIDCLALVPSLVSLEIEFRGLGNTIDDRLLRTLNVNLPGHILPRLSSLVFQGPSRISGESLDALITSRRDINLVDDRVALLETLTLDCFVPQDWSTQQLHSFNQRFLSKGLSIRYGQDWWAHFRDSGSSDAGF